MFKATSHTIISFLLIIFTNSTTALSGQQIFNSNNAPRKKQTLQNQFKILSVGFFQDSAYYIIQASENTISNDISIVYWKFAKFNNIDLSLFCHETLPSGFPESSLYSKSTTIYAVDTPRYRPNNLYNKRVTFKRSAWFTYDGPPERHESFSTNWSNAGKTTLFAYLKSPEDLFIYANRLITLVLKHDNK